MKDARGGAIWGKSAELNQDKNQNLKFQGLSPVNIVVRLVLFALITNL